MVVVIGIVIIVVVAVVGFCGMVVPVAPFTEVVVAASFDVVIVDPVVTISSSGGTITVVVSLDDIVSVDMKEHFPFNTNCSLQHSRKDVSNVFPPQHPFPPSPA